MCICVCEREKQADREQEKPPRSENHLRMRGAGQLGYLGWEWARERLSQGPCGEVGFNWFEDPTEHQVQSFAKLNVPGVIRAARQEGGRGREERERTDRRTHTSGRMEDGSGMQRKLGHHQGPL